MLNNHPSSHTTSPYVMILAGEASGDLYGAHLVNAMHSLQTDLHFIGMGGPKMKAAGVDLQVHAENISVVGIVEVFTHFSTIYRAARKLKNTLREKKPALLILIDFPDFNFHIAKFAKKLNIPIFYYISPQIWAWRKGRIHTMKKWVDLMAVILPFEITYYQKAHIPVCFEGHPLIDIVHPSQEKITLQKNLGLSEHTHPIIGLLPGSRRSGIKHLLPTLIETALLLKKRYPHCVFLLPLAPTLSQDIVMPYLKDLPIHLIPNQSYDVLSLCDVIITSSGTVTLEAALLEVPMVITYKLKKLNYLIGKCLVKISHIGLCNLIANERIVPELLQEQAHSEAIAHEVQKILDDEVYRHTMKQKLKDIKNKLGQSGATERIAKRALALLKKHLSST